MRAAEEELESERQAKDLLGRQFITLSFARLKSMEQYEALQARLQNSMAEQKQAQSMATSFQKKLTRLDKQVRALQQVHQDLAQQLRKANTVNDVLKKHVAQRSGHINELLELQAASQNDNQKLRKENLELKKRLARVQKSVTLLLDPSEGSP